MAIGAGIAAAIGVFSAIYAKAPAWGTDWTSATGLFGATFSAFVAAATAVIAAGSASVNSGPASRGITMRHKYSAFRPLPSRIRRYGFVSLAFALVSAVIGLPTAARAASGNQLQITAMTYNLFQGSELTEAISAATPAQFLAAVAADYGEVQRTDFPQRAQAIAAEAQSAAPDLIGLQEAALWQTGAASTSFPPPPASTVSYDFVQILVDALNARGLHYAPVAVTTDFTVQGPRPVPEWFHERPAHRPGRDPGANRRAAHHH